MLLLRLFLLILSCSSCFAAADGSLPSYCLGIPLTAAEIAALEAPIGFDEKGHPVYAEIPVAQAVGIISDFSFPLAILDGVAKSYDAQVQYLKNTIDRLNYIMRGVDLSHVAKRIITLISPYASASVIEHINELDAGLPAYTDAVIAKLYLARLAEELDAYASEVRRLYAIIKSAERIDLAAGQTPDAVYAGCLREFASVKRLLSTDVREQLEKSIPA